MSSYPSSALGAVTLGAGSYSFYKTRSLPQLVSSLVIASWLVWGSRRIDQGKEFGYIIGATGSLLMVGAGTRTLRLSPRARRFVRSSFPQTLVGLGALGTAYYGYQAYLFNDPRDHDLNVWAANLSTRADGEARTMLGLDAGEGETEREREGRTFWKRGVETSRR